MFDAMLHHCQQWRVIIRYVQKNDRFLMAAKHFANKYFEYFLKCPKPAREGDERVASFFQNRFAFPHVCGHDQFITQVVGNPLIDQKLWCDSGYLSARPARSICE